MHLKNAYSKTTKNLLSIREKFLFFLLIFYLQKIDVCTSHVLRCRNMIYAFQSWGLILNPPSQNAPMVVNNLQQINNKLGKSAVFQLCLTIAWANSKVVQPHTIRRLPENFLFFFAFEGKRRGSSSSSQIVKHIFSIHKTCSSNSH